MVGKALKEFPYMNSRLSGDEIWEMKKTFDRPARYTLNALQITPASKNSLSAEVGVKGSPGHYLMPQVEGGARPQKRSEHWLASVGPAKERISPFPFYTPALVGARFDQYGNVSPGQITQAEMDAIRLGSVVERVIGVRVDSGGETTAQRLATANKYAADMVRDWVPVFKAKHKFFGYAAG